MAKPKVCILQTDGTNCDEELFYAFEKYGGSPEYVHINQLRTRIKQLKNYQILAIPGGFAYGDDVVSGKILAVELISFLKNQINDFVAKKGLILGICNGFQVLVRTGLLPFGHMGKMHATLTQNESGHFECRFIKLRIENSKCAFLSSSVYTPGVNYDYTPGVLDIAVNHGEGKFYTDKVTLTKIENLNLVAVRYIDDNGRPTQRYPDNPNGSLNAIAGVTDLTGRILGLMPHPEKIVDFVQHPNWRRVMIENGGLVPRSFSGGGSIFEGMIKFAKQS